MSNRQAPLIAQDEIVVAPYPRACDDQTFEIPTGIYAVMIAMFTGFIVVLNIAFSGHMGITFAAIFAFIAAFFAIPIAFARIAHDSRRSALPWHEFVDRGIDTATGRSSAASATVLVLTLPVLIFCFGVAIATIAALT